MRHALLLLALLAGPAQAGDIQSAYSDLKRDACENLSPPDDEEACCELLCRGHTDIPVRIWEGDLRNFVGFGKDAHRQCASLQTFRMFNSLGPKVEWRLDGGKPFATILRWFTDADGRKQNWLVVTKVGDAQSCHVAYVEAGLPDANQKARDIADSVARRFDCVAGLPAVIAKAPATPDDVATGAPCGEGPFRNGE